MTPRERERLRCFCRTSYRRRWQQRHLLTRSQVNIPYPFRIGPPRDRLHQKTRDGPSQATWRSWKTSGCREAKRACSQIITSSQRYDVKGKRIQLHHWQLVLATHYAFSDTHPKFAIIGSRSLATVYLPALEFVRS